MFALPPHPKGLKGLVREMEQVSGLVKVSVCILLYLYFHLFTYSSSVRIYLRIYLSIQDADEYQDLQISSNIRPALH